MKHPHIFLVLFILLLAGCGKSEESDVGIILSAYNDRPFHGATYEIYVDGELVDSIDRADSMPSFSITVKRFVGSKMDIEGRVKYKNGYGAVMDEKRVRTTHTVISGSGLQNYVDLEIPKPD